MLMHFSHYARDSYTSRASHQYYTQKTQVVKMRPSHFALSNSSPRSFLDVFFIATKPTVNQRRASYLIFYRAINKSLKIAGSVMNAFHPSPASRQRCLVTTRCSHRDRTEAHSGATPRHLEALSSERRESTTQLD